MTILTKSSIPPVASAMSRAYTQRVAVASPVAEPVPNMVAKAAAASTTEATTAMAKGQAAATQLEQVQRAIDKLKQSIKPSLATSLKFEIDQSSGKTLVKIMDVETSAVVRQIPCEELLVIARALDSMDGRGGLVRQQA